MNFKVYNDAWQQQKCSFGFLFFFLSSNNSQWYEYKN